MSHPPAISVCDVSFHYGARRALDSLQLEISEREIFAFVGPNGGGKTTLFRLLATLVPLQQGRITLLDRDLATQAAEIRRHIGVVFQAPSLDKKLTVEENLRHQGHLYGLRGAALRSRQEQMLEALDLTPRRGDLVEQLSGGLRRRVELAKGMLHGPRVLLLDEPSTGLDPAARSDLWQYLLQIRNQDGVTVVLTTHLLEEAEKADRLAILHEGRLVAVDTPDALKDTVGGDAITIQTRNCADLAARIQESLDVRADVVDNSVRLEMPGGHQWIARLVETFPGMIDSVTFARPTLEDVFIDRTGHRFRQETVDEGAAS